jgi:DNA-binding NarL/FixJ family response regulator
MLSVFASSYAPCLEAQTGRAAAPLRGYAGLVVEGWDVAAGPTAVIADRMPLFRVGLAASLRLVGVTTVAQVEELLAGVEAAQKAQGTILVLGGGAGETAAALGRQISQLGATRVVAVVPEVDRRALVALLESGADAVALRTILPENFGALVRRVLGGERSVDPALMSVLIDLARDRAVPVGPDPSRPGSAAAVTVPTETPGRSGVTLTRKNPDTVPLTTKELQVLTRLAHGDSNAEIAEALYISPATVKTHLAHIYAKLGVGGRHGAMSRAVGLGLLH